MYSSSFSTNLSARPSFSRGVRGARVPMATSTVTNIFTIPVIVTSESSLRSVGIPSNSYYNTRATVATINNYCCSPVMYLVLTRISLVSRRTRRLLIPGINTVVNKWDFLPSTPPVTYYCIEQCKEIPKYDYYTKYEYFTTNIRGLSEINNGSLRVRRYAYGGVPFQQRRDTSIDRIYTSHATERRYRWEVMVRKRRCPI